jgi:hypothetical protein
MPLVHGSYTSARDLNHTISHYIVMDMSSGGLNEWFNFSLRNPVILVAATTVAWP